MVKISRLLVLFMALSAFSSRGIVRSDELASLVLMDDPVAFGVKMKTLVSALKGQDYDEVEQLLRAFTKAERTVLFTLLERLENMSSSEAQNP